METQSDHHAPLRMEEKSSLLMNNHSESDDIPPEELSGDENADKSILVQSHAFSAVKANTMLSVAILMKTVIGVGILSLPFVISTMGIIPTVVVYFLAGVLSHFTTRLLLKAKNLSGHSNYSSIMYHLHPQKSFKILVSLTILGGNFGASILELMFFKSTARKLFTDVIQSQEALDSFYTSESMILIVVALALFPITLLNKIEKLRIMSFLGITGILVFIFTFLIHYSIEMANGTPLRSMEFFPSDWNKAVSVVPNVLFSLAFQSNFFPIFKGIEGSSDRKMVRVVVWAVSLCISSYFLLGFLGYSITQKKSISPNYLEQISYAKTNGILFAFMNGGFLISLFFSFPIVFFSCRNNLILIINNFIGKPTHTEKRWREQRNSIEQISDYVEEENALQKKKRVKILYILYTTINMVAVVLIAAFVASIESVFNLVGALSCSSQSILFPLYFYITLVQKKGKMKKRMYYLAVVLLVLMVPLCLFAVVALYI